MQRSVLSRSVFFLFISVILLALSCQKFEGEQTIPAYLHIDTVLFSTDYPSEGSNTHKITDVWVYVNDQLIGAFELPATFPVLASGIHKLEIRPGIKLNGIAATRVPYPFFKPYLISDFNFIEDSVLTIHPITSYYSNITFAWMEDFEGSNISLEKTTQSDTNLVKTFPSNNPEAFLSDYSSYSGLIHLEGNYNKFQIATFMAYELPGKGTPVFLEMDYKCDRAFGVGMFATINSTILSLPILVVNASEEWNKIYINLSPNVTEYSTSLNFKIYFESDKGDDNQARFLFDNIKLIYRNNS